jgi:DNA-binding response OmpR family regulator
MEANPTTTQNTARVLVVDDEGANRYSVGKTLQRVGYIVTEAASGEEALEHLSAQKFDVVLTDVRMDGIDGVELLRRIKEATPDIIVILMTGYASLETAVEALRLGAHDYLIKPSSSQDIRASVSKGVERARNLRRRRSLLDALKQDVFELSRSDVESRATAVDPSQVRYDADDVQDVVVNGMSAESGENGMSVTFAQGQNRQAQTPNPQIPSNQKQIEVSTEANPTPSYRSSILSGMNGSSMQLGPIKVFPGRYQISVNAQLIDLTPTEFDLLLYLAAHRGRVVPCHELVREVRGYAIEEAEAREVIRPHVSNLRRKLKTAGQNADLIVNVRGIGYRLSERAID